MKKFLVSLCLLMFLASCSSDDSSKESCDTTFPFLTEGRVMNYTFNTTAQASITIGSCGDEGYEISRITPLGNGTDVWRQNGEFLEVDSNGNKDYYAKTYKSNAALGDTWSHTKSDGDIVTHTVISVDSTITVPAGTFTCKVFSYESTGIINTSYVFWDDEIGQIKEDAGFVVIELESYENQ